MATKQPAMSPSDMPVEEVLLPLTPPRRAEADQLLALFREVSGEALVARLGPHTASKACLYLKRLTGVDLDVLRRLLELSQEQARAQHVKE